MSVSIRDSFKGLLHIFSRLTANSPFVTKLAIALVVDVCICLLSTWLAFYLRLEKFFFASQELGPPAVAAVAIALPVFYTFGFYKTIFRYSGWRAVLLVGKATFVYGLIFATIVMVIGLEGTPRTVGVIQPILLFIGVAGSRLFVRLALDQPDRPEARDLPHALVYGADVLGRQIADFVINNSKMRLVGFIDDDTSLHGRMLNGVRVFGSPQLQYLIDYEKVSHVLLSSPVEARVQRRETLEALKRYAVVVRYIPPVFDIATGNVTVSDSKEPTMDELLSRGSVLANQNLLAKTVLGRTVLVTGAGGSIGSELCRQIARLKPKKILLVEVSEYALYQIYSELESLQAIMDEEFTFDLVPLLVSIQDENRLKNIMDTWRPDTIYHAAAYKHVPLVESNILEGVKNNVLGTLILANLAIEFDVSNFVLVSTDKAVRPTNVMGATKRMAELCLQSLNDWQSRKIRPCDETHTEISPSQKEVKVTFSMVRFGNVLESSGSVIPKFRRQIREGGPITLTDPDVERYFMTVTEAAQLVMQAGALSQGGEVFILDMGKPVKIMHLARKMIDASGLSLKDNDNPDGDIEIKITGLRPGEKICEELFLGKDPQPTAHPSIQYAQDAFISWPELQKSISQLRVSVANNDLKVVTEILLRLVSGFNPDQQVLHYINLKEPPSI